MFHFRQAIKELGGLETEGQFVIDLRNDLQLEKMEMFVLKNKLLYTDVLETLSSYI